MQKRSLWFAVSNGEPFVCHALAIRTDLAAQSFEWPGLSKQKKICIRSHWMVSHHLIASIQKFPSAVSRVSVVVQFFFWFKFVLNCLALRFSSIRLPCVRLPFVHS